MNSHDILIKFLVYAHKVGATPRISMKSLQNPGQRQKQNKQNLWFAGQNHRFVIQWILGYHCRTPRWLSLEHLGKMMISDVFFWGAREHPKTQTSPIHSVDFPHPFRPFWWNSTGSLGATPGPCRRAAAPPAGAAAAWAAATVGRCWRRRRRAPARPVRSPRSPRRAGGPGRRRGRGPPPCLGKNGETAARTPNSQKSTQQFDIVSVDL